MPRETMLGREHGGITCRTAVYIGLVGLFCLGACAPMPGQGQVAVRFYPPPGKSAFSQQADEGFCTRTANGYVRSYVECMQQRGYRSELIGAGGAPMTVGQLPSPPTVVAIGPQSSARQPIHVPEPPSPAPRQVRPEPIGKAPTRHLAQSEFARLIEICPNIPRGRLPTPPPLPPASLEARQCAAFEPVYMQCATGYGFAMLFGGVGRGKLNPEHLRMCLRNGYNGP
jgi:hypothetical protein